MYFPLDLKVTLERRNYYPYYFDEKPEALRGHVVMAGKTGIQTQVWFHPKPLNLVYDFYNSYSFSVIV